MRGELETKDNQLSGITSELERLREDQHSLKGEVKDRGSAIVTLQTELEKVRGEVLERDVAIATLKSELERAAGDKQLNLFPPTPTPTPEPVTISPVTEPELTPEPKPEAKLLNPRQLAEWINNNCNPEKPVKDHNLRDWFNKKSTCTNEYRAEKEILYRFKFSHQDSKGTCWFTLP